MAIRRKDDGLSANPLPFGSKSLTMIRQQECVTIAVGRIVLEIRPVTNSTECQSLLCHNLPVKFSQLFMVVVSFYWTFSVSGPLLCYIDCRDEEPRVFSNRFVNSVEALNRKN